MNLWKRKPRADPALPQKPVLRCSFCNKSQLDVAKLIAGPRVYICSECVDICNDILAEGGVVPLRKPPTPPSEGSQPILCALCKMSVPLDLAMTVQGRGWVCRVCVNAVRAASDDPAEGPPQ